MSDSHRSENNMVYQFRLIYDRLLSFYGPQHWWPAEDAFEMMIGAILVQNTNWRNVEKALDELRPVLTPSRMEQLPTDQLAQFIRSSGYYNVKARRIKSFLQWFKKYDYSIEKAKTINKQKLREELLSIKGLGRETADAMLVYAFDTPIFIVDAYARRIFQRLGYDMPTSYDRFRMFIEDDLPSDVQVFNEYHALLVEHAKAYCKKKPICDGCPLSDLCSKVGIDT